VSCAKEDNVRSGIVFVLLFSLHAWAQPGIRAPDVTPASSMAIGLEVDAHATGKPLVHYWSKVVGAGRDETWAQRKAPS